MGFESVGPRNSAQQVYDASAIEILEGLEPVRKRPGMFIGGTDNRALHHLAAEVLDNSMDEAVAGHANRIEVHYNEDNSLTVRDNGRGIPVDPHPKCRSKSALEVILTTLHAGGKFSGKAYQTAGGLHGVGISVVNALSESMHVEVVRDRARHEQSYARGKPLGPLRQTGSAPNRRGTSVTFKPDPQIFGKDGRLNPVTVMAMVRSKAYLFSGVEMRWRCSAATSEVPEMATFHFPGGLEEFLRDTLKGSTLHSDRPFAGKVKFAERFGDGTMGSIEWAVNWSASRDGFTRSYCNTVPTSDGGTHEAGFWTAILKGIRAYGEFVSNRRAVQINREDLQSNGCALVSCFIGEPEFVGQTKDRLASSAAHRLVENSVRDHFDNWLAADPKTSGAILDHLINQSEDRLRRKAEKETARKSATKRLRLPGKLVDCSNSTKPGTELFIVEGDSAGGSAKMARDRRNQALLPLRGKILNVLGASAAKLSQNSEINDLCLALGVRSGSKFDIGDLRYEKIIIMTDADVDGAHIASLLMTFFFTQLRQIIDFGHLYLACPPLYRITQGATRHYARDDAEKELILTNGVNGKGKVEVSRFKGLGEMDAKDLKSTTMNPNTRKLIKVGIDNSDDGETGSLITRLMGRKPEERFRFIQSNARFASDLDI
ncbi:MAG: type IIA DNA topoisomerase subunit B [Rhodobacteraceae bacterium]|nr:type IIA DNA topoisomerase subunit B [Paracoccaceae bacterium]